MLDTELELIPGHGITERAMQGIIANFNKGDFGILDGWELEDRAGAEAKIKALAARWDAEDRKEAA